MFSAVFQLSFKFARESVLNANGWKSIEEIQDNRDYVLLDGGVGKNIFKPDSAVSGFNYGLRQPENKWLKDLAK